MILPIRALSVNKCWQGKRFKTTEYKHYCRDIGMLLLGHMNNNLENKPYEIVYVFWLKNWKMSDIDNPVKPITDILVA
jgi:hypothetical protein